MVDNYPDSQTYRQTDTQSDSQSNRQTDTLTLVHTCIHTHIHIYYTTYTVHTYTHTYSQTDEQVEQQSTSERCCNCKFSFLFSSVQNIRFSLPFFLLTIGPLPWFVAQVRTCRRAVGVHAGVGCSARTGRQTGWDRRSSFTHEASVAYSPWPWWWRRRRWQPASPALRSRSRIVI